MCGGGFVLAAGSRSPLACGPRMHISPAADPSLTRRDLFVSAAIFVVALLVFLVSPIHYDSDSRYTLLLTESLLTKGSFVLDGYGIHHYPPIEYGGTLLDGPDYQLEVVGSHYYYLFPPGSSILSAPFVLAQDAAGKSVVKRGAWDVGREQGNQHFIASILMAALAAIFYFTARLLLPAAWSTVIALGAVLGTQVWSTASRVLWSHTWGIALLGCVLWLLLAQATGRRKLPPVLLATLLSWTYFVRPTNSLFIIGITVYVLCYQREIFLRYALTGAAWFAGFVAYSWNHYGALLPAYYRGSRLEAKTLGEGLAGNLISPSRGLLLFVPVVLFVVYLPLRYWRHRVYPRLLVLAAAACGCHYAVISSFVPWHGGGCYGPRYTTELVPWLVLITILGVAAALREREEAGVRHHRTAWRATLTVGGVLLLLGVLVNGRGATSVSARIWSRFPATIDQQPWRVWDWRYPQVLAGLISPPLPDPLPVLTVGERLGFGREQGRRFQHEGWVESEEKWCWSSDHRATLVFAADGPTPHFVRMRFAPYVFKDKLTRQRVVIRLNGQPVADLIATGAEGKDYQFPLSAGAWQPKNRLTFDLPDATMPITLDDGRDQRLLGIELHWLEFDEAEWTPPPAG